MLVFQSQNTSMSCACPLGFSSYSGVDPFTGMVDMWADRKARFVKMSCTICQEALQPPGALKVWRQM